MLGKWKSHSLYQTFIDNSINSLSDELKLMPEKYKDALAKLKLLNLDELRDIIAPLYSVTGRPSNQQSEIFRCFILMNHLSMTLDSWVNELPSNRLMRIAAGFHPSDDLPGIASYYDFIDRVFPSDERPVMRKKKKKPKERFGKNKMPPKKPGIVAKFVKQALNSRQLSLRPERYIQEMLAQICVRHSLELGLINRDIVISGDGTCIETGASPFGAKKCDCKNFKCDCPRSFSDPGATWGWDSSKEQYYYGYTGYFMSTYNKTLHLDLPVYLRFVEATRHDSVSAVIALAEFRKLCPFLHIKAFLSDSASDNYPTYELLDKWNISAVIALNPKNTGNLKYPQTSSSIKDGVPLCAAGYEMKHNGYCPGRRRTKWRCPVIAGNAERRDACDGCSKSAYGRVVYTKPSDDLRLFTRIPRGSDEWKCLFKQRTAAERINNRILNHYNITATHMRSKKRIAFFSTIAAFNVHLDAWCQCQRQRSL